MTLSYYLTIDGIVGDSTSDQNKGAFDVVDYNFDASALVSVITGGGSGASKPTFSPLTVDLDLNSGFTALLKDLATGKTIPSIELKGISTDGHTVYDLKLGDVTITTYHDTNSGHDMLTFTYQQVSLTTTQQLPDGSLGTPATFSWDIATNSQDAVIPDPVVPSGSASGGGGVQAYYLTIDGIVGDSTSDQNKGAFDVVDYNFDASALVSVITGGGSGASKPTFSPLTVDLDLNSGFTALLKDLATGKTIPSIELKGVSTDGHTVYDLKLGDVTITTYHDTNSGHDMLTFTYQQVSLTTTPQLPDGSLGTPATFSWDIATNSEGADIPTPVSNHAPIAVDDFATAITGIGGMASGNVLTNDHDPDGDQLSVSGVAPLNGVGSHGSLTLNADGTFSYTITDLGGPTGTHLHDVFTYSETDGRGGTASAVLDITLNRAPDVLDNIAGVKVGATAIGNVVGNDSDPDGDTLTVVAVDGGKVGDSISGTYGTLLLKSDGSYSYTASHGATGQNIAQDVFHFTETDGHGGVVQSALTFSVISNGQTYFAGVPGETLVGGNGKGVLDGSLGDQHLLGGNGADILIGGKGDVLTGGNGPDQFIFKGDFGRNEITDFARPDLIKLEKSTFGSVAEVLSQYATEDGHGNTIITDPHNSANVIILDHMRLSQLHASDLQLV